MGDVAAGFAEAEVIHEGTYDTQRVQHAHLETHCSITWLDAENRPHVRTSSQTPHITKQKLCYLFDLYPDSVHVFCERVGGGFGGKQEVLTEDICVAATLKTGRLVKLEFTREEHQCCDHAPSHGRPHPRLARRDGTLTAIQMRVVSNTGAYGNHGGETLYAACGEAIAVYRCPAERWMRMRCTPTLVLAGAIRGYGMTQTIFAVESAMDELARTLPMEPSPSAAATSCVRKTTGGRDMVVSDTEFGSYGLDQCLDLVESAWPGVNSGACRQRLARGPGRRALDAWRCAAH